MLTQACSSAPLACRSSDSASGAPRPPTVWGAVPLGAVPWEWCRWQRYSWEWYPLGFRYSWERRPWGLGALGVLVSLRRSAKKKTKLPGSYRCMEVEKKVRQLLHEAGRQAPVGNRGQPRELCGVDLRWAAFAAARAVAIPAVAFCFARRRNGIRWRQSYASEAYSQFLSASRRFGVGDLQRSYGSPDRPGRARA